VIDDDLGEPAVLDDVRQQPQLPGGPPDLAGQPPAAQRGLLVREASQLRCVRVQDLGNAAQQTGAPLQRPGGKVSELGGGRRRGAAAAFNVGG
jgi:hypothetical protein